MYVLFVLFHCLLKHLVNGQHCASHVGDSVGDKEG